ncbi:MAG: hypothetical protein ABI407_11465 [Bradyrhizobium sp.]
MADATKQLRAFEDSIVGAEARRINGQIERGRGSAFEKLSAADRARHAALERLIVLERTVETARVAADVAQTKLAAATQAHGSAAERLNASAPAGIDVSA